MHPIQRLITSMFILFSAVQVLIVAFHSRLTVLFRAFNVRFGFEGLLGGVVSLFMNNAVVGGTQGGLDNMVKLSEEAQKK